MKLDPQRTALVLIDLQQGIVGRALEPRTAATVVENARRLTEKFRAAGATIVLVRVTFQPDGKDRLNLPVDAPMQFNAGTLPANWAELVPDIGPQPGDLIITKRQWGAFYGTELDLQLRRRGVRTIVLGGIATNFGVESTARDAYERGYEQVFVEDAMATFTSEAHYFVVKYIFPRIGLVRGTDEILAALVP
jgi:nicotinamidase-related amidase